MCIDDRRFFKTPYWKLKKKTKQQKIRYIETAIRLLDDSRKSRQQTLRSWRQGTADDDSSTDGMEETNETQTSGNTTGPPRTSVRRLYRQTSLRAHFGVAQNESTESIDGESALSSTSAAENEEENSSRGLQHTAGVDRPAAALVRPTAGQGRPPAARVQPSAVGVQPSAGQGRPSAARDAGASQKRQY